MFAEEFGNFRGYLAGVLFDASTRAAPRAGPGVVENTFALSQESHLTIDRGNPRTPVEHGLIWQSLLLRVALVVVVASFLVCEVYDLDVWWHLAIGRDILTAKVIPTVDHYATGALGQPYHDSHWLFQVAVAIAYRFAGWIGVQAIMVALWSGTLVFCHRETRAWTNSTAALVLVFLAAMASVERFLPRPELVTYFGIAAFYYLLQQRRFKTNRDLALLAILQVVWANSHGLFVMGPFMAGCYWLASAVRRVRRRDDDDFVPLTKALGVVVLSTLLTPFGARGWWYAGVLLMESRGAGREVIQKLGELSPTFGAAARSSPAFWFYLALVCLMILALPSALVRKRLSARTLILAALFAASLSGRRNIVLFSIVAAPQLAEWLPSASKLARALSTRLTTVAAAALMLCYAWFPLSGRFFLQMELPSRTGFGITPSFFPHGLPRFLDEIRFRGQVLNSNSLGGFFMFYGYPDRLPLTDGRWEAYDPATLARVISETHSSGAWRQVSRDYDARGLLLAHTSAEAAAILPDLRGSSDWRLVYVDQAASFWLRAGDLPNVRSLDPRSADFILPIPHRADDGFILNSFLTKLGIVDARILNLQRTLRFGVRRDVILEQLGPLLIEAGRLPEASEALESLLAINPKNEIGLNELSYLSWVAGDRQKAISLMERLLKVAPRNEAYRENYRRLIEQTNPGRSGNRN